MAFREEQWIIPCLFYRLVHLPSVLQVRFNLAMNFGDLMLGT